MGEFIFGRSNYEIAELTWQNGQPEIRPPTAIWGGRTGETLESVVQQATWKNVPGEKWAAGGEVEVQKGAVAEWNCETLSMKGSNCMESNDTTTCWANSFDSTPSFNKLFSGDQDSVSLGGSEKENEVGETKTETARSGSSRRTRAAAVHNQSERRRRERINQKMKALQRLVPNASKTDKASMLDEVIEYLKQLQAQVQLMSNCNNARLMSNCNNARLMMQQYQLQFALLSRMGSSTTPFLPPPFLFHSSVAPPHASPSQPMNMEIYNKMAQVYLQQVNQGTTNH